MNESLLTIAGSNMLVAHRILKYLSDNPRELNIVGYHLQQAAEFGLKFILEEQGIDYPKTHDIERLFDCVLKTKCSNAISDGIKQSLFMFAATLTSWEAQTRYVKKLVCRNMSH